MSEVSPPPSGRMHHVELTAIEIDMLIRFHRLEAVLLMNGETSRVHMARADRLRRVLAGGSDHR